MYTVVIVLTVIVSILLIAVVLVQKSKGGGLASGFSGANSVMGVRHTNDFIEKATWTLAGIVCALAIISVFVMPGATNPNGARVKAPATQVVEGTEYATPAPTPVDEATAPAPVELPEQEAPAIAD